MLLVPLGTLSSHCLMWVEIRYARYWHFNGSSVHPVVQFRSGLRAFLGALGGGRVTHGHTCQKLKNIHRAIYIPNFAVK